MRPDSRRDEDALGDVPSDGADFTRQRSVELFGLLKDDGLTEQDRTAAREDLVHLHLPLVEHCARRFRNRGEPFEDLVQVGTIGLIKSVDRFEAERGVEFSTTYATPTIIGEIKDSSTTTTRGGRSGFRGGSRSCG